MVAGELSSLDEEGVYYAASASYLAVSIRQLYDEMMRCDAMACGCAQPPTHTIPSTVHPLPSPRACNWKLDWASSTSRMTLEALIEAPLGSPCVQHWTPAKLCFDVNHSEESLGSFNVSDALLGAGLISVSLHMP